MVNTTNGMAYLSANRSGGRIVAFDLPALREALFNEKYILAHTSNLTMPR